MYIRPLRFTTSSQVLAVLGAAALAMSLSACATGSAPAPSATATTPGSVATPDPTTGATAAPSGTPVEIDCSQLVSAQAMYDYNPNFALETNYLPEPGSLAATAAEYQGLVCGWVNETSGERITVSVAEPSADTLVQIGNGLIGSSNSVPTYEVEGYFIMNGTSGQAEAIATPYWITASSTSFLEPGDAAPIVAAALTGLGL